MTYLDSLQEALLYALPSAIVGFIAFYFFKQHLQNEERRRKFLLQKELQNQSLPLRLQAYERMTLFLERLRPSKLLIRTAPSSSNKDDYESLLIASIEQEFEHNLTQQLYMTSECWNVICAAKNATIQLIRKAAFSEKVKDAHQLRELVLTDMTERQTPSDAALAYIKKEISDLW